MRFAALEFFGSKRAEQSLQDNLAQWHLVQEMNHKRDSKGFETADDGGGEKVVGCQLGQMGQRLRAIVEQGQVDEHNGQRHSAQWFERA